MSSVIMEGNAHDASSSDEMPEESLSELAPMTFRQGKRTDDSSDSEFYSDDEIDGRNKPLPAPPASSSPTTLSPPKPNSNAGLERSSPSISHISNISTSTVSSYVTASSASSFPVTPVTPSSPLIPLLSTAPELSCSIPLSRASSFSRRANLLLSGLGSPSRQPSIVSLAGGYHLPTMVSATSSPTVGHKSSLPLLNDTGIDADVDGYFNNIDEETNTSTKAMARLLTRQPSLGSHSRHVLLPSLASDPDSSGTVRRYASAGNLLSTSSPFSGSGHTELQHKSLPFPTAFPPPSDSSSPPHPSLTNTPTASTSMRSRADSSTVHIGESRVRSRAGSTTLRNAVYIEALDSSEVERRLLDISSKGPDLDVSSEASALGGEAEDDANLEQSKWSPASSVVGLRSPVHGAFTDSSSSFGWGFPKPPKAPPPTPSATNQEFPITSSGSSSALAEGSAMKSPASETKPKRKSLLSNMGKRKSTINASSISLSTIPSSPSRSDLRKSQIDSSSAAPGKRQRLTSFIAKLAGNIEGSTASMQPVPPTPTSSSASGSAPPSPTKSRATTQHRPAPLDLSAFSKPGVSSIVISATDPGSATDTLEPSTPTHSVSSSSSWDETGSETGTETEDEMEDIDPDLIVVAAGFDLPSIPASPRTPRIAPLSSQSAHLSPERRSDFPSTPTDMDIDAQMGRGSYAQVYGFRSPKMSHIPTSETSAQSFTYLPLAHSQLEASVPRGATPTVFGTRSLIGPGDLPPSGGNPKTPRVRKTSVVNTSVARVTSRHSPPPSIVLPVATSSSPRQSSKISPGKNPKSKNGRMAGFISRFTFGSSISLAASSFSTPQSPTPPVPPLGVDELGQIVPDPFAKDDTTSTMIREPRESTQSRPTSFITPGVLSPEINGTVVKTGRERSGTTTTTTSAYSSSTVDSPPSSIEERRSQKVRRSLGLTLNGISVGARSSPKGRGKKRKLVISGVDMDDTVAYQAVKDWCEGFGEIRKLERQDNGNLVVDWRRKSVGDMVCRVQANVVIKGAGSVTLSWYQC